MKKGNGRFPPLNALRAFEAAARHSSFKIAANELHVTPGAVSRRSPLEAYFLCPEQPPRYASASRPVTIHTEFLFV